MHNEGLVKRTDMMHRPNPNEKKKIVKLTTYIHTKYKNVYTY